MSKGIFHCLNLPASTPVSAQSPKDPAEGITGSLDQGEAAPGARAHGAGAPELV